MQEINTNLPTVINTEEENFNESEGLRNQKKEKLSELLIQIQELKTKLFSFEMLFNKKVAVFKIELKKIQLEILKYQEKIRLLNTNVAEDEIEKIVTEEFSSEQETIYNYEKQMNEEFFEFEKSHKRFNELDKDTVKELKILYKQLAKKFHPDIVAEENKEACTLLMKEINDAYTQGDFQKLQEISEKYKEFDGTKQDKTLGKINLLNEIDELDKSIQNLAKELESILSSEIYKIYTEYSNELEADRNILSEQSDKLKGEILSKNIELEAVIEEYNSIKSGNAR